MKVIFSLFFIFLYCKQSAANDLWIIDKNISSIEFEVPVLFANNVIGKFNEFDGFVSLDLSNQNNNKALINVRIDSLDIMGQISVEDWKAGCESGEITEVFACGTAAVITPVGEVKSRTNGSWAVADGGTGPVTSRLRQELLDIQTGESPDRHNWLHAIC